MASYEERARTPAYQIVVPYATAKKVSPRYVRGGVLVLMSFILAFITLEISVYSIEQANWVDPQPNLTLVLISSFLAGWLLSKSRLPGIVNHLLALLLSLGVMVGESIILFPLTEGVAFPTRLKLWWLVTRTVSPGESTVHFTAFLVFTTFVCGYYSAWALSKKQNVWVTVIMSGVMCFVNLGSLTPEYYRYFLYFFMSSLLLVGVNSLTKRVKCYPAPYSVRSVILFLTIVSLFSLLLPLSVWQIPEIREAELRAFASSSASWRQGLDSHPLNPLASVPRRLAVPENESRELSIGEAFGKGDDIHFIVSAKRTFYLRTGVYDTYTHRGWKKSAFDEVLQKARASASKTADLSNRIQFTYRITSKKDTSLLLTAGDFESCDLPVMINALLPPYWEISLTSAYGYLPEDVTAFATKLRAVYGAGGISGITDIKRLLPPGLQLSGIGEGHMSPSEGNFRRLSTASELTSVTVSRRSAEAGEIVAIETRKSVEANKGYTVAVNISTAGEYELARAGTDYPLRIKDFYLQLPPDIPDRVKELAQYVTKDAKSVYDKAKAIQGYLLRYPYMESAPAPPQGEDGADYFLFSLRAGNCGHFATAMAVTLRSLGIPVRVCTGYSFSEKDKATGDYIIRVKEYHAWPEVYFPGYGWVEFEATPGVSRLRPIFEDAYDIHEDTGFIERPEEGGEDLFSPGSLGKGIEDASSKKAEPSEGEEPIWGNGVLNAIILGLLGLFLLVAIASAFYGWLWHFNSRDFGTEIYRKMYRLARLTGLAPTAGSTPEEYGRELSFLMPALSGSFSSIIEAYYESRYGQKKGLSSAQGEKLEGSWRAVAKALLKRLFRPRLSLLT